MDPVNPYEAPDELPDDVHRPPDPYRRFKFILGIGCLTVAVSGNTAATIPPQPPPVIFMEILLGFAGVLLLWMAIRGR